MTFTDFAGLNACHAHFQLNVYLAGLAIALNYIVIGLSHWLMGFRSNKTKTRYDRRKPSVMIGALF